MKLKHFFTILIAGLLALSLVACNGDDPTVTDTNTYAQETTEKVTNPPSADNKISTKTYDAGDIYSNSKILGRTVIGLDGLGFDHSSAGFEFNAYIEGKLTVDVTVSTGGEDSRTDDCYFTLFVDGVRSETRFKANKGTKTTLTLANFSEGGVHNIRFVRQTEGRSALATVNSLTFKGYFATKPTDAKYYIEFMGASNTAGYGNLTDVSDANVAQLAVNQDSTQSYTYLTAKNLEADYSMLSVSGIGVVNGYRKYPIKAIFDSQSYYRAKANPFDPTRIPDLVVMAVGSNDEKTVAGVTTAAYKQGVIDLITGVRAKYGKDVPIVWVYYTTTQSYRTAAKAAIAELGGTAAGIYDVEVLFDSNGGNNHPSLPSHVEGATKLTQFIKDNNILK